jgi:hypothetical protein
MPDATPGQPAAAAASDAPASVKYAFVAGERDVYFVPAHQSLTQKYVKAVTLLDGGASRRAAAMIAEVYDHLFIDDSAGDKDAAADPKAVTARDPRARDAVPGASSDPEPVSLTAMAYYWILAIMSGRAFEQLTPDDFAAIELARSIAGREAPAELLAAYDVLRRIIDTLQGVDQGEAGDQGEAEDQAEAEYEAEATGASSLADECGSLAEPYREEIYRHLGTMLADRLTEEAEAALAADAESPKKALERRSQARKYFEQVPVRPWEQTFAEPVFPTQGRVLAASAGVVCLVGVPLAIAVLQERGVVRALLLSAGILLATVITIRSRIAELAARERIADKGSEFGERHVSRYSRPLAAPGIAGIPVSAGSRPEAEKARQAAVRMARFTRLVSGLVDDQFAKATPPDQTTRTRWLKETAGLKDTIRNEMLLQYSDSASRPGALNWLIEWRIREITRQFNARQLRAYQQQMLPPARVALGYALGAVVSVVAGGYAAFLVLIQRPVPGAIALVLIGAAAVLAALSRVDIYLVDNRRRPDDLADAKRQHEADLNAYRDWRDAIADPPGDDQIACWLDLDKIRLMKLFMRQVGVPGQHVLAHATLTEPAPGCVGRRMPYGPPRYSAYKVTIFLLTEAGIRLAAMTLNFLTGEAFDQVRRAFRYNAMVSARVQESGIRYESASRRAMPAPAYPWTNGQTGSSGSQDAVRRNVDGSVILRQELRLSIGDGEGLRFLVENFECIGPEYSEDPVDLLDLSLDVSGIAAALELFETACGHLARPPADELADVEAS